MNNLKKINPFIKGLGILATVFSVLILVFFIVKLIFDIDGNWVKGFMFFIFILAIAGAFLSLGDAESIPFIAHYYGIALLFLCISLYFFFSISFILTENSFIEKEFNLGFFDGRNFSTEFTIGKYIGAIILIVTFGALGLWGYFANVTDNFKIPKIIPYTLATICLLIVVAMVFKYLLSDSDPSFGYVTGELFLFTIGAVGFYLSGENAKIF